MLKTKILTVLLVLAALGFASITWADEGASKDKTIIDRLDDVGKSIFGGIFPPKSKPKTQVAPGVKAPASRKSPATVESDVEISSARAGSILGEATRVRSEKGAVRRESELMPEDMPPAVPRRADGTPRPVRRPAADDSLFGDESLAAPPLAKQAEEARRPAAEEQAPMVDDPVVPNRAVRPSMPPLHERLSRFRESAFGDKAQDRTPAKAVDAPVLQQPERNEAIAVPSTMAPSNARRVIPEPAAEVAPENVVAPSRSSADPVDASLSKSPDVLFTRKSPVLNVETVGPRTIAVGQSSTYEVSIANSGDVAAEDLVVFVSLPEWAEIAGTEASLGTVQPVAAGRAAGTLQWNVGGLSAKGRERLTLRLIPRQSRPFDLAVRWESRPTASQALIEVQEPKLVLRLEGPKEVLYGKKQVYRLKLANTGNGDAENVILTLTPLGAGENAPASHAIAALPAGGEKILDVELVARQTGVLTIQAHARANGGAVAELTEKVDVRRASLKAEIEAPRVQFVGAATTCAVRIRNTGTAPAKSIKLSMALPAGAKYLSGIEGAQFEPSTRTLSWNVDNLDPQIELSFTMKCGLETAGTNRLNVQIVAEDDLFASAETFVRMETVAHLTMDVKEPAGPVPLGQEATYEVRLRNRGSKEAREIEVFGFFSLGIEPIDAEGIPNRCGDGQVSFQPIASLKPGEEIVLKIRARAGTAGNHIFRAETRCQMLNVRLIRETTNLYYADNAAAEPAAVNQSAPGRPAPSYDAMRPTPHSDRPVQVLPPPIRG